MRSGQYCKHLLIQGQRNRDILLYDSFDTVRSGDVWIRVVKGRNSNDGVDDLQSLKSAQ